MIANILVDRIFPVLLSLTGLAAIGIWLKDFSLYLLQETWKLLSTELPIWSLLILVAVGILTWYGFRKFHKPKYFFFDYDSVKWKANKKTGKIEEHPYCSVHVVQLVWDTSESYYCPVNGERKNLPTKYDIENTRKGAQNVASAIVNGHLKNENQISFPKIEFQQQLLRELEDDEKDFLKVYIATNTNTQRAQFNIEGAAMRLRAKQIIFTRNQTDVSGTFLFEIRGWALKLLKENPAFFRKSDE
jgi:hypothetical protein